MQYDHELASALVRHGYVVTLLASPFAHGDVPEPSGYRREEVFLPLSSRLMRRAPRARIRLVLKGIEYVPSALRLVQRIRAFRPEVVHVQWLGVPRYDIHWLRRVTAQYPTVFTAHDVVPRVERNMRAWGEVLASVDRVIVQSQRAVEQLAELGVDRARLVRIPHPVFHGAEDPLPPTGATLLFFGLIRDYKGLDVLIRALPAIAARVPEVRLLVAGDPLDPVEPVQRLTDELGMSDRVEWRLHFLGEQEIAAVMQEATLVVLPYRRIDSSGVLATALGHGRPAVVTDVGGLPDPIHAFSAGRVVPADDVAALADACAALLADRTALIRAFDGTGAARRSLTWDAAAAAHEEVYEQVVGARGGAG